MQKAWGGCGNMATGGQLGLGYKPTVQTGQGLGDVHIRRSGYAPGLVGPGTHVPGGGPGLGNEPTVWNGLGVLGCVMVMSLMSGGRV